MSASDRIVALGPPSGGLAALAARTSSYEVVEDLDTCLERLTVTDAATPPATGRDGEVGLVAVDPAWVRPLSVVRRLRAAGHVLPVALVVPAEQLAATGASLALLPEAGEVAVVPFGDGGDDLRRRLDLVSRSSREQRKVRGALDTMNQALAGPSRPTTSASLSGVSAHYLAALVRHAADAIVAFDGHGRIITLNAAAERTLGLAADEADGLHVDDLTGDADAGELSDVLAAAASGTEQTHRDLDVHLRDGRRTLLSATAAGIGDDTGALVGFVLIARDVTAERHSEEQLRELQKAESLATLASGVAHDFNNLLVQLQGWADLARRSPEDLDLVTEALDNIGVVTRQAAELSRAMLVYGGRGTFERQPVDLPELMAELRPLLEASVPAKIELTVEPAAPAVVHGDPTQLRQIVLNLVGNAAEAIEGDRGAIVVRTGVETIGATPGAGRDRPGDPAPGDVLPAGPYGVIEVEDTGPGVAPEHRQRLFDPFFTTKFTGRGLGLAASQGIARAHGGIIAVHDAPGGGARFRVHLPALRPLPAS